MKADAITPGNCELAPGCLATISIDVANSRVVKTTDVQRDYIITTPQRPIYQTDGRHRCVSMPVVAVISSQQPSYVNYSGYLTDDVLPAALSLSVQDCPSRS